MKYQAGDRVVYRKTKSSTHPGPRATEVRPAAQGESYRYQVDKYWTVAKVLDGGRLEIVTRTGKRLELSAADPNLRKPTWLERIRLKDRFPPHDLESARSAGADTTGSDTGSSPGGS